MNTNDIQNKAILMVEDDADLLRENAQILERNGYTVHTTTTLRKARKLLLEAQQIDIAVLDIILPDGDGLLFASEVKEKSSCPVLMLTSKNKHKDIVEGMNSDADVYMTKPYRIPELVARIEGLLLKQKKDNSPPVIKGSLRLDVNARQVTANGEDLALTSREFSLLLYLARRENEVVPMDTVFKEVWGQTLGSDKSAIQNTVSRLRKKLSDSGYTIISSRNAGYMFERK